MQIPDCSPDGDCCSISARSRSLPLVTTICSYPERTLHQAEVGHPTRLRRTRKSVRPINAALVDAMRRKTRPVPIMSRVIPRGVCMARMPAPPGQTQVICLPSPCSPLIPSMPCCPCMSPRVAGRSVFPALWACPALGEKAITNTRSMLNQRTKYATDFIDSLRVVRTLSMPTEKGACACS